MYSSIYDAHLKSLNDIWYGMDLYAIGKVDVNMSTWAWPPNRIIMWRYSIKLNNLNLIMGLFYSQCANLHQVFRWTLTPPGISDGWTWFEVCNKDYDIRVIMTDPHNVFIRDFSHRNRTDLVSLCVDTQL